MRLLDTKCPHCGANLVVDFDRRQSVCEHCGATLLFDDEKRHVVYDNAEEAGYQFERGRQRAAEEYRRYAEGYQAEAAGVRRSSGKQPAKHSRIWLWVLGWVLFFPIPLTVLIWRNERLTRRKKIIYLAVLWGLMLLYGIFQS